MPFFVWEAMLLTKDAVRLSVTELVAMIVEVADVGVMDAVGVVGRRSWVGCLPNTLSMVPWLPCVPPIPRETCLHRHLRFRRRS